MYVITNREIDDHKAGLEKFGRLVNSKGPNELRLAEVRRHEPGWQVAVLGDELPTEEAKELIEKNDLDLDPEAQHYASLKVACELAERARKKKSHVLFFVHGYNNDMEDVVSRAHLLEENFGIEAIAFSWPANGGGVSGTVSYKSDKRDARASVGALERALSKTHRYLQLITEAERRRLWKRADEKHRANPEARDALYAELLEKECPFTVNGLFHSMGNYLLKQMLKSTIAEGTGLIFDNVVLCAADTNNLDHSLWVDRIRFRRRCFVTINEQDFALKASRAKAGSDQLARLGHHLRGLDATSAHYVNFTGAAWVRNSHAYFEGQSLRNDTVNDFFARAFKGEAAEAVLRFRPEGNWFGE